jgi:hypothetical protein
VPSYRTPNPLHGFLVKWPPKPLPISCLKKTAFWDSLAGVDRRFRGAYCLHRQGDDEGSTNLWNVGLLQGWANYGPLRGSMRPAEGLKNPKKKMRFRKIFENHVHVCFLIFVRTSFFQHEASKKQC